MTRNDIQRFRDTVGHTSHADLLYNCSLSPNLRDRIISATGLAESEIGEYFGMFRSVNIAADNGAVKFSPADRPELLPYFSDIDIPDDAWFDMWGVLRVPTGTWHFFKRVSPLRKAESLQQLEDYPFPDASRYDLQLMKNQVEAAHAAGRVVVCGIGHMYESAWQIRGYENFLMDMATEPEMCAYILDRLCERNTRVAELAAEAGADYISTGDDVANQRTLMFDIDMWRRFIKERWSKVYNAAKSIKPDIKVWYHSDGNIMDIIPELIEIGVDILNPVQPECMDLSEIKKRFGSRLVLDGTIGTQTTMPFGTSDEVRAIVRKRKQDLGSEGALILSPTHLLEPDVPVENVLTFLEECRKPL